MGLGLEHTNSGEMPNSVHNKEGDVEYQLPPRAQLQSQWLWLLPLKIFQKKTKTEMEHI